MPKATILLLSIFSSLFLLPLPADAQQKESAHAALWKVIEARPDAELKTINGIRMARLTGNVVCGFTPGGVVTCEDRSGLGGVGCYWNTHVDLMSSLKVCHMEKYGDLLPDMEYTISRISEFMKKNTFTPTTQEQIDDLLRSKLEQMKAQTGNGDPQQCARSFNMVPFLQALSEQGSVRRRSAVDNLLSVERPVVNDPC